MTETGTSAQSSTLRVYLSQEDVHYSGGLVAGARILSLFGDAGTALMLARDGLEGLLACYEEVQFMRPVFAGQTVDIEARITSVGRTSRNIHFRASVDNELVCTANAVAIARPLQPGSFETMDRPAAQG